MGQHTPTPWTSREWVITGPTAAAEHTAREAVSQFDCDGVHTAVVAQHQTVGKAAVATVYGMSPEAARDTADLIVRAVNSHDQIVAALTAMLDHHSGAKVAADQRILDAAEAALTAAGAA